MLDSTTKQCTKCGEIKPATLEYFHKDKGKRDGFHHYCKTCRKIDSRAEYLATQQEQIAYSREYRARNPEKVRESKRNTRLKHLDSIKVRNKKWQQANLHRHRQYNKKWRINHPEQVKEVQRQSYLKNPRYYIAKSLRRKGKLRENGGSHTQQDIVLQYKSQRGKCWWCEKAIPFVNGKYHVDHLKPISLGGTDDPSNLVITCPHCNLSRKNKLPHEWIGRLI